MGSSFRISKPNPTCNLIWIFLSSRFITATFLTGLECSFYIKDSLRPNGPAEKNSLPTQQEVLSPANTKAQIGLLPRFFAELYTNARMYWCTVFNAQHGLAHVFWLLRWTPEGFGRPSVSSICTLVLYEHHFAHCYICYILTMYKLSNSALWHYSWKHKSHYFSFQLTGKLYLARFRG